MIRALGHRGPDDAGLVLCQRNGATVSAAMRESDVLTRSWLPDADGHLAQEWSCVLGHRRLSIIDPTPAGHQPMVDRERRTALVFNGEIYNYVELRAELERERVRFRTGTDTEVILQAFLRWGPSMVERLNGMWAFALADLGSGRLLLSRDRIGEKPLFFTRSEGRLYFASEIGALFQIDHIRRTRTVNDQRVWDYLYLGLRDHHWDSFYQGIKQIPPGTINWVQTDGGFETRTYWQLPRERWSAHELSFAEAATGLRRRLKQSVALRLRSDRPVGAELSGGMDSTSIAAMMAEIARETRTAAPQTLTIRYPDREHDESPLAQAVASRWNLPWESICLESQDYWETADTMLRIQGQPYESPNQIGSHMLWRWFDARGVRVVLSGGGGDELLAGYIRHMLPPFLAEVFWQNGWVACWDEARRWWRGPYLHPAALANYLCSRLPEFASRRYQARQFAPARWRALRRPSSSELDVVIAHHRARQQPTLSRLLRSAVEYFPLPMYMTHGDKLAMSIPVEVRFPFLDPELMDFAFRLPVEYFFRHGESKAVLREAMREHLPVEVLRRRDKMGFPVPLERWMREGRGRILSRLQAGGGVSRFLNADYCRSYLDQLDPGLVWRIHQVDAWMRLQHLA